MKLESLIPSKEFKTRKRIGRGPGSGMGKTSTRGQNGQKARSGAGIPAWFQGGQTPLFKRLPRRGFNNKNFEIKYAIINLDTLNKFNDGDVVTLEVLKEKGIIKKELSGLKVLATGTLEKKVVVKASKFSNAAVVKIEENGGKAEVV